MLRLSKVWSWSISLAQVNVSPKSKSSKVLWSHQIDVLSKSKSYKVFCLPKSPRGPPRFLWKRPPWSPRSSPKSQRRGPPRSLWKTLPRSTRGPPRSPPRSCYETKLSPPRAWNWSLTDEVKSTTGLCLLPMDWNWSSLFAQVSHVKKSNYRSNRSSY